MDRRLCACGCGASVTRRYRPGHDARHKSHLVSELRSPDWRARWVAADLLADLGWSVFADPADLRAVPYRTRTGRPVRVLAEVDRWQVDHEGTHHADRRCALLTARAREMGEVGPVTHLARDRYVTYREATPDLAVRLAHSWDQCPECTTDHTRDERAESTEVARRWHLDEEPRQTRRRPPVAWEYELDDGSGRLVQVRRCQRTGTLQRTWPTPVGWEAPDPTDRRTLPHPTPTR